MIVNVFNQPTYLYYHYIDNQPLPPVCSYNFECPKDFICVNNQCICRKCEEDYDCHRYGMFCHRPNDSGLGECRKRCTPVKVWTEWCGCGVNEICEPIKASITDIDQGFRLPADLGGICKSARFVVQLFIFIAKILFYIMFDNLFVTFHL